MAIACSAVLVAGFVGQFPEFQGYPWAWSAARSTDSIARLVNQYLPVRFQAFDAALLIALLALWILYTFVDQGLRAMARAADDVRGSRGRGTHVRRRSMSLAERGVASAADRGVTPPIAARPAPAAAPTAANPAYRPEALVVIDLVKSSDLVSRFGNSFFFSLKQKLEQLVTPVVGRHNVSYSENTGDGFLFCFPSITLAAAAVKDIFKIIPLLNRDLPEDAEAAFRAALNYGEVIVGRQGGNRTGTAVHKTFRLQGVGPANVIEVEGGVSRDEVPQKNCVFLSEEALTGISKLPDFSSRFLGLTELKGLPGLHRVYQLEWR